MATSNKWHRLNPSNVKFIGWIRTVILGAGLLSLLAGSGCSSLGPEPGHKTWHCQAEADDAVHVGDWQTALTLHRELVLQMPENCLAIYHLGYIQGKLGDRSSEAAHYKRAIQCGYDRDDQLFYNLGMAYGDLGQFRSAIEAIESAVQLNDANAENHFGLGLMYQAAGQHDEAREAFTRAISKNPGHHEARLALCRNLLDQGHLQTVRYHLEVLAEMVPDSEALRQLWRLYQQRSEKLYER